MKTASPADVRVGHIVSFGSPSSRLRWRVDGWQEHKDGCMFLLVTGPLDRPECKNGRAFYVGPNPLRDIDPITDKRRTTNPLAFRIVGLDRK